MADISPSSDHPNVLVVTGSEIHHDTYRDDLRTVLLDNAKSPVRRGTHHFWITYFVPTADGGEYDSGDLTTRPAEFRGVIRMGQLPSDTSAANVARHMRTMLEEVGHHWLVPSDLQFRANGPRQRLATSEEWTQYVNTGQRLPGIPLLGRDDLHWHSYLQADKSPIDGQWWTDAQRDGLFTTWTDRSIPGTELQPDGLSQVQLTTAYCDLDLAIIGKIAPEDAYPGTDNRFEWIEPTLLAPLPYHLGVCVCFSRTNLILFGYDQDHQTLGVYRTGGLGGTQVVSVKPVRAPEPPLGLALRVVRRGDMYHFQARADESVAAHLHPEPGDVPGGAATAPRIRALFDNLAQLPAASTSPDLSDWATVAIVSSASQPEAMGLILDKWDQPSFLTGGFFNLEVQAAGRETVHSFDRVPATLPAGTSFSGLGSTPQLDLPAPNVIVRTSGRRVLLITAPFSIVRSDGTLDHQKHFGHSSTDDRAPKLLVGAPSGDFAFGTSVTVHRTLSTPWAAGYLLDKQVWGSARSLHARDMVLSATSRERQLHRGTNSTFKFAFIVAASREADVTADIVNRIDVMRRYWDVAFPAASRGYLRSTSTL